MLSQHAHVLYPHRGPQTARRGDWATYAHNIRFSMIRLNSVKNTNFGLDNKKLFLTHWKTVIWVT